MLSPTVSGLGGTWALVTDPTAVLLPSRCSSRGGSCSGCGSSCSGGKCSSNRSNGSGTTGTCGREAFFRCLWFLMLMLMHVQ